LRGLAVSGGNMGIVFNSGGSLHLENVTVGGYSGNSATNVWFQPAAPARLSIKDSTIQSGYYGIQVANGGGNAGVLLDNVRLEGNEIGLRMAAGGAISVRNALVAGPGGMGIWVTGAGGVPLTATLDRVTISGVADGLIVGGSEPAIAFVRNSSFANNTYRGLVVGCCAPASAIWIDGNRITRNGTGIEISAGAAVNSRGNNTIEANDIDGVPSGTYSAK
jgi:Periplasmic copper-binding protein (NosD)